MGTKYKRRKLNALSFLVQLNDVGAIRQPFDKLRDRIRDRIRDRLISTHTYSIPSPILCLM